MTDVSGFKPRENGAGAHRSTESHGLKDQANLKDQAVAVGRDIKNKASELTQSVTQTAKDQAQQIGSAAQGLASDTAGKVTSAIENQKTIGADYIGSIAQAVHRAAGQFDGEIPQAARYIRQAAGQLESVAGAIRQRDMGELFGEVQDFARRQPTLFFGGAVILGFAALRFLNSTSSSARAKREGRSADGGAAGEGSRAFDARRAS